MAITSHASLRWLGTVLIMLSVRTSLSFGQSALHPTGIPVRVMSFNIRYGTANDGVNHWEKRKDFLVETITRYGPDLLGTQETLASQRDYLATKLTGYEAFGVGRDDGQMKGEMAALFYRAARFKKLDGGHFWLSETPDKIGSKGWDAALPRLATWVKLQDLGEAKAKPLLFVNTHFDHRGTKARTEAAKLIRTQLVKLGQGCRLIVTGDFNADEGSEPYQALFANDGSTPSPIVDTWRVRYPTKGKNEGTFSGFNPATIDGPRIDWIGCSRDWDVRLAQIDRTTRDGKVPSDHFPITAVLRPTTDGQSPLVRVLCYNIHHGEGTDGKLDLFRIAKIIRDSDPDVVALQEVDQGTKRTANVDQTAELAKLTGLHGQFGKAIDLQGGGYGQAILARDPLTQPKVYFLPNEPAREQRIAFAVQTTIHGQSLMLATTHLDHQLDELRLKQATKINDVLGQGEQPLILAGDFNATPESKPMKELLSRWTLATSDQPLFTIPADKPNEQIDFIMVRPASRFRTAHIEVLNEAVASDHRPIMALLEWKPAPK